MMPYAGQWNPQQQGDYPPPRIYGPIINGPAGPIAAANRTITFAPPAAAPIQHDGVNYFRPAQPVAAGRRGAGPTLVIPPRDSLSPPHDPPPPYAPPTRAQAQHARLHSTLESLFGTRPDQPRSNPADNNGVRRANGRSRDADTTVAHSTDNINNTKIGDILRPYVDDIAAAVDPDGEEPQQGDDDVSAIHLRISTAVSVRQDRNLVCLDATPADQANAIARAIVGALHDQTDARGVVSLTDEEGRPRPIRIQVDAGLVVEGSGNVVGKREAVEAVVRMRAALKGRGQVSSKRARPVDVRETDDEDDGEEELEPARKRPRSAD